MSLILTQFGVLCSVMPDHTNAARLWRDADILWRDAHPPSEGDAPAKLLAYGDLGRKAGAKMAFCTLENRVLWLASLEPQEEQP